jgi:hypothetical protein
MGAARTNFDADGYHCLPAAALLNGEFPKLFDASEGGRSTYTTPHKNRAFLALRWGLQQNNKQSANPSP